ncbi:hypothetical protein PIB30_107078, partial [Stylosanthes scabra]|nr:hypothetical protein [Stylosanthes scabra]
MSRNPPLFGDVLSAEEPVLGCYFVRVSFRSRISNEWISGCGTIPDRLIGIV